MSAEIIPFTRMPRCNRDRSDFPVFRSVKQPGDFVKEHADTARRECAWPEAQPGEFDDG